MRSTQNKGSPTARLHLQPGPINVLLDDLVTLWFEGRAVRLSTRDWTRTHTCLASTLPRNYLPALFLLSSLRQMLTILLFSCDHKPAGASWATEHVTFLVTSPHSVTHQQRFVGAVLVSLIWWLVPCSGLYLSSSAATCFSFLCVTVAGFE